MLEHRLYLFPAKQGQIGTCFFSMPLPVLLRAVCFLSGFSSYSSSLFLIKEEDGVGGDSSTSI